MRRWAFVLVLAAYAVLRVRLLVHIMFAWDLETGGRMTPFGAAPAVVPGLVLASVGLLWVATRGGRDRVAGWVAHGVVAAMDVLLLVFMFETDSTPDPWPTLASVVALAVVTVVAVLHGTPRRRRHKGGTA